MKLVTLTKDDLEELHEVLDRIEVKGSRYLSGVKSPIDHWDLFDRRRCNLLAERICSSHCPLAVRSCQIVQLTVFGERPYSTRPIDPTVNFEHLSSLVHLAPSCSPYQED